MRPPLARPWTLAGLLAGCIGLAGARAGAAPKTTPEQVRVTYRAPPECPGEEALLDAVRARIGTDWEAPPEQMARSIDITVGVIAARSVARIDFVDDGGAHVSRTVSAATCSEAVAGIALVTALAIESRVAEVVDESEPVGHPAGEEPPTGVAPPTSKPGTAPPPAAPAASRRPATRSVPSRAPYHFDVGVAGAASSGVGPAPAFGGRFVAGLGWAKGPDLRIGVDYWVTASTTVAEHGGVSIRTYQLGGRASGCPFALSLGGSARILPCAGIASGIAHAETRPSAGVRTPGAGNPPYVAPFAELRLDFAVSAVFVELSAEVRFVVDNPTFALEPPDDRPPLYPVPVIAGGGSLGVGLRL